jgi:hypothetical protein
MSHSLNSKLKTDVKTLAPSVGLYLKSGLTTAASSARSARKFSTNKTNVGEWIIGSFQDKKHVECPLPSAIKHIHTTQHASYEVRTSKIVPLIRRLVPKYTLSYSDLN